LPRFLGVWLALAGIAWVIVSLTGILLPQYQDYVYSYSQPAILGEIAFMLWLTIKGARPSIDAKA
jgi:amino acid transporter